MWAIQRSWLQPYTEELHNLYSSPDISVVIATRKRRAGHRFVAEMRNSFKNVVRKFEMTDHLGDLRKDG
jgi:hypothetical protein